jgi:hypothetical protein
VEFRILGPLGVLEDGHQVIRHRTRCQGRSKLGQPRQPKRGHLRVDVEVRALQARCGELRAHQVVRSQSDEPIGLDAPPSLEDLLDRQPMFSKRIWRRCTPDAQPAP